MMTISHLPRGSLTLAHCQIRVDGEKATALSEAQAGKGGGTTVYICPFLIRVLPFPLQAAFPHPSVTLEFTLLT